MYASLHVGGGFYMNAWPAFEIWSAERGRTDGYYLLNWCVLPPWPCFESGYILVETRRGGEGGGLEETLVRCFILQGSV